jgi:hypothetical protein
MFLRRGGGIGDRLLSLPRDAGFALLACLCGGTRCRRLHCNAHQACVLRIGLRENKADGEFAAKPATVRVKVRSLKKLKDAALWIPWRHCWPRAGCVKHDAACHVSCFGNQVPAM